MYGITPVFYKNYTAFKAKNEDGSRKYKYIINTGSSRSSKTYSIIELIYNICESNNSIRATAWRDTKKDCRDTVWKDFQKILSLSGRLNVSQRNKTEATYYFKNGSTFEFHGTDDEEKVHGLTQNIAWINEPYKISKDTFDQIDMRSEVVFIDWNPKKKHWIDDLSNRDNAIVIHSTYKDNPFCPVQSRIKMESYQPLSCFSGVLENKISEKDCFNYDVDKNPLQFTKEQISELKKCIQNEQEGTADIFNYRVYTLGEKSERPNKIFKGWKQISYADFESIEKPDWYGVDWGKVDPFGIVRVKYTDGRLYIHELNYSSENDIMSKLTPEQRFAINKENEEGIVVWLFNKLGIDKDRPIICDWNRPDKVRAIYNLGYEYADTADKGPGSKIEGIDIISKLEVFYTRESENLANEYDNYSYRKDRYGVVIEEPEDDNDHLMDCIRYVVLRLKRLRIIKKV